MLCETLSYCTMYNILVINAHYATLLLLELIERNAHTIVILDALL